MRKTLDREEHTPTELPLYTASVADYRRLKYTVCMIHTPITRSRRRRLDVQSLAIGTFIILLVVALGFFTYSTYKHNSLTNYTNNVYGISFEYPNHYTITESDMTNGSESMGTAITLIEKGVHVVQNGEGPTAITIAIYTDAVVNVAGENPVEFWIRRSPYSNFTLSRTPTFETTTVDGHTARTYTWDGLYQGTSVITENKGNIIMASVTYDGSRDTGKQHDFKRLIETFTFSTSTTTSD